MKRINVLLGFIKYTVSEKTGFYRNAIAMMRENPAFPSPDVSLSEATALIDQLEASSLAARNGGHTEVSNKRAAEQLADVAFRSLALYVDRMAAGNEVIILSSGFNPSRQPASIQKADLRVMDGSKSGSVKLMARSVANAHAYLWQMVSGALPLTESDWITITATTRTTLDIPGLTVAGVYYFRVAAVTAKGKLIFTAAVRKLVV